MTAANLCLEAVPSAQSSPKSCAQKLPSVQMLKEDAQVQAKVEMTTRVPRRLTN